MRIIPGFAVLAVFFAACSASTDDAAHTRGADHEPVLPFVVDDYAGALAQAKDQDLPIFVETWAPW